MLQEFLDIHRLLEMQEAFTRLTGMRMHVLDAEGRPIAPTDGQPTPPELSEAPLLLPRRDEQGRYVAPIVVAGRQLGLVAIEGQPKVSDFEPAQEHFRARAKQLGLDEQKVEAVLQSAEHLFSPNRDAAVQFLYLWANGLTQLCYQGYELHHRVEELSTLYKLSTLLSAHRNLQQVLDAAARSAAEVMNVKAASIRLLDDEGRELLPRAVYNLSEQYLNKGPVVVEASELYRRTLAGEITYVEDMATDERVLYPEDARREGLVSILAALMIYQGRPIGVIRLYTGQKRAFTKFETNMLRAVAQLLAAAIENTRLMADHAEGERVQRQVRVAAAVQRRMMPSEGPKLPPFDIAARYVPSYELGGDFYDFIDLDGHVGIAVGDVVGKGIPASLLMASVRASLRAYAQDVYDLDEIISRVNVALTRDTLDNEFATLFYAVIDPTTRRMTYCNAGHEPPLLLRGKEVIQLEAGGMIVGVDERQKYEKGLLDFRPGDLLLIYTDGLTDAQSFKGQRFGRPRVIDAMRDMAHAPARDALNHILWQMRRFTGLKRNIDDTTLVVVKVDEKR